MAAGRRNNSPLSSRPSNAQHRASRDPSITDIGVIWVPGLAVLARDDSRRLLRRLPALPDRGVDLRHHLLGEQLHVAPPEIAVLPVLAGEQQRAEIADFLAERQDLIGYAVGRAPEHQFLAHRIE